MKRKIKWVLPLVLAMQLFALKAAGDLPAVPSKENQIHYHITIDENNWHSAKVAMTFVPKDSLLYMTQGAGQLPDRWATFVHDLKVTDASGRQIGLHDKQDALWVLERIPKEQITVSYTLELDHEKHNWGGGVDGVAYATDWGVFYTGRALLVFNGADWEDIRLSFDLPKGWEVSTPFERVGDTNTFKAHNQAALMQAMLFAGTHKEFSFKEGEFELLFALGGEEVLAEEEVYKKMASGVLEYYINLMGGLPNPAPGNAMDKALVIINVSDSTDGEIIGNNISILLEKNGDAMAKMISRFIFAHEFFHMWNGKSFTPEDQETQWFNEGFSNYYTLKALRHIGFINDEAFFGVLNNLFYQRYSTDTGLGKLSMTRGEEKHDHWGLIYGGGLFVAMAQDINIRMASDNSRSIDDLMRTFYKRYGGTDELYTIYDIEEELTALNGTDQAAFFKEYIRGVNPLPIADYLKAAGLEAKIVDQQLRIAKTPEMTALQQAIVREMLGGATQQ